MLVMIAVLMVAFMVTVAFSIDVAMMHLSRAELRAATDAAARAAAGELSDRLDVDTAVNRGIEVAAQNTVASEPLRLIPADFTFGRSIEDNRGRFKFSLDRTPQNSVRVNGRRTAGSPSGPVTLFFGNLFGVPFFEPRLNATATFIRRDVVLVVDRSGSMQGGKFDDLVSAIDLFIATLDQTPSDERVGLASYNDRSTRDVELTEDLNRVRRGMRRLSVGGFTSISRGMNDGGKIMRAGTKKEFVERTMIVMTDGRHNRGPEPREEAIDLAAEGVTLHTITFGGNADRPRMREVAAIGGGNHYHADDGDDLREIYRDIALTLTTVMTE